MKTASAQQEEGALPSTTSAGSYSSAVFPPSSIVFIVKGQEELSCPDLNFKSFAGVALSRQILVSQQGKNSR